jgi:hypothetical protein
MPCAPNSCHSAS